MIDPTLPSWMIPTCRPPPFSVSSPRLRVTHVDEATGIKPKQKPHGPNAIIVPGLWRPRSNTTMVHAEMARGGRPEGKLETAADQDGRDSGNCHEVGQTDGDLKIGPEIGEEADLSEKDHAGRHHCSRTTRSFQESKCCARPPSACGRNAGQCQRLPDKTHDRNLPRPRATRAKR